MTSHPPAQTPAATETVGGLDELLSAERGISDLLAQTDAEAEGVLATARDEIARRHDTSRERLLDELTALESRLRAAVATEASALIAATRATTEQFDHVTDAEVAALADFVLQRLYDVTPNRAERAR